VARQLRHTSCLTSANPGEPLAAFGVASGLDLFGGGGDADGGPELGGGHERLGEQGRELVTEGEVIAGGEASADAAVDPHEPFHLVVVGAADVRRGRGAQP
jgi:hypothetical protein